VQLLDPSTIYNCKAARPTFESKSIDESSNVPFRLCVSMTGWCGWGLACRLQQLSRLAEFEQRCVLRQDALIGGRGRKRVAALRRQGRSDLMMPEHQDALLASSSSYTTFLTCLRLEADGRNCANKRACSNNKSVPCKAPGGVSGLHGRMLMSDARQTHCSIHTRSSPRHQTYLRNRQKRRCEWRQGSMRFWTRYFHMLKLLDAVTDMVTRGRALLVNSHAF